MAWIKNMGIEENARFNNRAPMSGFMEVPEQSTVGIGYGSPADSVPVQPVQAPVERSVASTPAAQKVMAAKQTQEQKAAEKDERDYAKMVRQYMAEREKIAADNDARIAKMESRFANQGSDYGFLMRFADQETGGKFGFEKSYREGRLSENDIENLKQKLSARNDASFGQMTDDSREMLRMDMMQKQYDEANKNARMKMLMGGEGAGRKLGADDIKRLGYITSMQGGLRGIKDMFNKGQAPSAVKTVAALKSGVVGDNDLSRYLRDVSESFGRMQSGGAINKEEEKRFLDSLYKFGDTDEMVMRKIESKLNEVNDREAQLFYGKDWKQHRGGSNTSAPKAEYNPNDQGFLAWKKNKGL